MEQTRISKIIDTDVLIVGSGLAGAMCALKAVRSGCKVLMVSKSSLLSGNSIFAGGGFLICSEEFTPEEYIRFVLNGGKGINDAGLLRVMARRGELMLRELTGMGMAFDRHPNKKFWRFRTNAPSEVPGRIIMKRLIESMMDEGVRTLTHTSILKLLQDEDRITGAMAISRKDGMLFINAKAVVLATGGAGAIYRRNDNHGKATGDGYSLALEAGLRLKDMEFVQFYPLGLAEPMSSSIIIYPPIPEEARIINEKKEDLFIKYDLKYSLPEAVMEYRDELTLLLTKELQHGPVYMDCTEVPTEKWETWFLNMLARINPAFKKRPFSVMPSAHFFMGGVEIDDHARTALPGLFAAGEVTAGVHGANRHGGNSFAECIVFGDIAGASAAEYALKSPPVRSVEETSMLTQTPSEWKNRSEKEKDLFNQLQDVTWSHAGPIRSTESLQEGLSRLDRMEKKIAGSKDRPIPHRLNEINQALMVSKTIMTASLERKESRGAFFRKDYPESDDRNWLKNILLELDRETADLVVHHQPVGSSENPNEIECPQSY
jgi:succinate dehydrogenase/fumarate reductase flavoprotein subunit